MLIKVIKIKYSQSSPKLFKVAHMLVASVPNITPRIPNITAAKPIKHKIILALDLALFFLVL